MRAALAGIGCAAPASTTTAPSSSDQAMILPRRATWNAAFKGQSQSLAFSRPAPGLRVRRHGTDPRQCLARPFFF